MNIRLTPRLRLFMVVLVLALAACGPEDGRARGGGPGGDANNKPAEVVPKSKVFSTEAEGRNP